MAVAECAEGVVSELSAATRRFQARSDVLRSEHAGNYERCKLAYEMVRAYTRGQRAFTVVQSRILARLRADAAADPRDRTEALAISARLHVLRDLMQRERATR